MTGERDVTGCCEGLAGKASQSAVKAASGAVGCNKGGAFGLILDESLASTLKGAGWEGVHAASRFASLVRVVTSQPIQ